MTCWTEFFYLFICLLCYYCPVIDLSLHLQGIANGPKRVPVSQQAQKSVVTPTPHQRVLGLSNGPQRLQRPASHQKPVAHVPAVKSVKADQNVNPDTRKVNPALQSKQYSTESHPKTNAPTKGNPEPPKQTSESAVQETPQSM